MDDDSWFTLWADRLIAAVAERQDWEVNSATSSDWELVRWIEAPPVDDYLADLRRLDGELLLLGP